jgi:hypothetical protein
MVARLRLRVLTTLALATFLASLIPVGASAASETEVAGFAGSLRRELQTGSTGSESATLVITKGSGRDDSVSVGMVAGIAVGAGVAVGAAVGIVLAVMAHRRKKREQVTSLADPNSRSDADARHRDTPVSVQAAVRIVLLV